MSYARVIRTLKEDDHKIDPDLKLPNGKVMILQADDDKYIRGLGIKSNADGSYDSYYWYNDPKKKVPIEIKIDGKSVDKDAKNVHWAYHPELEEAIKEDGHADVASMKNKVEMASKAIAIMKTELDKLGDDDSLPSWWTNKVAVAVSNLDSMADYLDVKVEDNK